LSRPACACVHCPGKCWFPTQDLPSKSSRSGGDCLGFNSNCATCLWAWKHHAIPQCLMCNMRIVIIVTLPPKGRPIVQTRVLTSLIGGAANWFLSLLWVPLCNRDLPSGVLGKASPSIWSTDPLAPSKMLSQQGGGNTVS
jgi:hypothetical protein